MMTSSAQVMEIVLKTDGLQPLVAPSLVFQKVCKQSVYLPSKCFPFPLSENIVLLSKEWLYKKDMKTDQFSGSWNHFSSNFCLRLSCAVFVISSRDRFLIC